MKRTLTALIVASWFALWPSLLRTQAARQEPSKKYADFCGVYRFDLTSHGAGLVTASIYEDRGALYIWSEMGESPDRMSPVENEPTRFFLELPNQGRWDFEFLKDERGQFTKCRLIHAVSGIDTIGKKIAAAAVR